VPAGALARVSAFQTVTAFAFGPLAFAAAGPVAGVLGARAVLGFGATWSTLSTAAVLMLPAVRAVRAVRAPIPPAPPAPRAPSRCAMLMHEDADVAEQPATAFLAPFNVRAHPKSPQPHYEPPGRAGLTAGWKLARGIFGLIPLVPFLYVLTGGDLW